MERQGVVPDVYVYSSLIHGYCKSHNLLRALALHDEMISRGVKTNCVVVSCILHCLGEMGMTLEVVDQFKELKESGMFLDGVAYNIVFDALCMLGKVEDALVNSKCPKNLELRWQTEVSSSIYANPLIADINR